MHHSLAAGLCLAAVGCAGEAPPPLQPSVLDSGATSDAAALDGRVGDSGALDGGAPDTAVATDAAVAPALDGTPPQIDMAPIPAPDGWRLVWNDEFDAPARTPPDPQWWVHDIGGDGWGNAQLEYDTDRIENAAHDGAGHLAITARDDGFGGRDYSSARIKTQGRFSQRYGRFEARIRQPEGAGMWPAFWLLGDDITTVGWPDCGEIDIMEYRGQDTDESTGALHGPGYSAGASRNAAYDAPTPLSDGFHVYAVEWHPDRIDWFVDDTRFLRVRPQNLPEGAAWVFDKPFFVILNLAVGGTFVGPPNRDTVFPQQLLIDYVRVYEAAE